jgi:uncharacterized protein YcfJ
MCALLVPVIICPVWAEVYTNEQGQKIECDRDSGDRSSGRGQGHPVLGTLAGGAIGGLAGHQFGKGSGNTAMTAAGAAGGAVAGHKLSERKQEEAARDQNEEHCHPID